ncbi:MAG: excisionase family DNA-binding protein [Firmicutes bacterium]|nr:excisionase family DNA-binding protein [Bacillota bacterium]
MVPKYWSVQEVCEALNVRPPTLRRWLVTGEVQSLRLSGGSHRRIPYDEVARLAKVVGQAIPALEPLKPDGRYRLEEAATYLGVSVRFLRNQELSLTQGGEVTGSDILGWEAVLYRSEEETTKISLADEWAREDEEDTMSHYGMHRRGHGPMGGRGFYGGPGWGPWDHEDDSDRPHSVLWLRSMKRHLEARKADIEDRLAWVEEQLKRAEKNPGE